MQYQESFKQKRGNPPGIFPSNNTYIRLKNSEIVNTTTYCGSGQELGSMYKQQQITAYLFYESKSPGSKM